jgi:NAD(P)-dependent dehydrogenase (short-subunit alcohol dehydrogenase family)
MSTLNGKLALITGASRGIGQAVAKRFALEGADLILAARSIQNLEKVDDEIKALNLNTSVTLVPIDLKHGLQIEEMIRSIASRFGKLDILIGNAGYLGTLTPLTHQNAEEWQEVLDINLTANWHLLRCADPLLKKSMHGRALFVTSGVGKHPSPYWGAYSVSKAALNHMVKMYAFENISSSVKANLIDPGFIRG